ncbi:hypothetical protein DOTSEDRAFT_51568 [Dothistroma septosporum NZE10]|uniref:Carboxypeptidase n=1 Tax=Dothistroma septosporum (strain NZE10 / CBS 128990) TaxID=675120 RepID=N1PSQ3_DOTSN|nr:hypothetical protein DOTSEDRAFT_51568 [Dothistroma septosporum NZE10]
MRIPLVLAHALLALCSSPDRDRNSAPDQPKDVRYIKSPNGAGIRYKENGLCETTPGVKSYSGYIDVNPGVHMFFWFFESRSDPAHDPVTLWQNGGPGADSLIGLFEELGPCFVTNDTKTHLREWSWNKNSNLLFLSQPVGTGFSYALSKEGYQDSFGAILENFTNDTTEYGRFHYFDTVTHDTSTLNAPVAWECLQALYGALPALLDDTVKSTDFIFWAESYGGHFGPAFAKEFYEQNQKIDEQKQTRRKLNFKAFGLVNACIDYQIQEKFLLEFTQPENNPYGLKLINDTIYDHGKFALERSGGCQDNLYYCVEYQLEKAPESWIRYQCSLAQFVCQNSVESLYYTFGGDHGPYDIRTCDGRDGPPSLGWRRLLNTSSVQNALGVDLNYTDKYNEDIYNAFSLSGDFGLSYLPQIEELLKYDIQIAFMYGDADYICCWTGGEAVSLNASWEKAEEFKKAGYAKLVVDGREYGEVRQVGKFSFTRVWESGHEVPYFQPEAAFAIYNRSASGLDIATGTIVTNGNGNYATEGPTNSTYRRVIEKPEKCPKGGYPDW